MFIIGGPTRSALVVNYNVRQLHGITLLVPPLPSSWYKSMSLWQFKRPLATIGQTFMVNHHFCPVSVSLLSRECWIPQLHQMQCGAFVLITFRLWAVYKLPTQTKVAIMPTNNRPIISENIARFLGLGLSQRGMSGFTEVSQGAIYTVFVRAAVFPMGNMDIYWRQSHKMKTVPISVSWGEIIFSQRPASGWNCSGEIDALFLSARSNDLS